MSVLENAGTYVRAVLRRHTFAGQKYPRPLRQGAESTDAQLEVYQHIARTRGWRLHEAVEKYRAELEYASCILRVVNRSYAQDTKIRTCGPLTYSTWHVIGATDFVERKVLCS
jgi:hypothetical protein